MRLQIRKFFDDEAGATAIEYSLIGGLIFLVIVAAVSAFAGEGTGIFNVAMNTLTKAIACSSQAG